MDALQAYLDAHYLAAAPFARACRISADALAALMDDRLVPKPSYVVTADGTLHSAAFGAMPAGGATPGEYHHRGHAAWVARARELQATLGTEAARTALQAHFTTGFAAAFAERGADEAARLATGAWDSFLRGVHGVCVADPSSVENIARKESLQATLAELTANGTRHEFPPGTAERVLGMIDDYAASSMAFAPPEYPRSSRKRLVDDLRARIASGAGVSRD